VADHNTEAHHAAPRCLLRLHERAKGAALDGEGIQAWLEWEWEAARWRVPVEIPRDELEELVRSSAVVLEREQHRPLHASDWQRWGRRGDLATLGATDLTGSRCWRSSVGAGSPPPTSRPRGR
jgi:hypothetical protein